MACRHLAAEPRDTYCRTCAEKLPMPQVSAFYAWQCVGCGSDRRRPSDFYCPDCGLEQPAPATAPRPPVEGVRVYPPSPPRCETKNGRGFVCVLSNDHVNDHVFTD